MENLILYQTDFPKKRIGKNYDGGYVIVELPGQYDFFISGGISNDVSFEEDLLTKYPNLTCVAFDGTIASLPKTDKQIQFIKKNLGNINTNDTTNLLEYIQNYNDIFMKIDIEGHEFRVMPVIIKENYISKIKQLVIEIHSPGDIHLHPNYFKGLSDIHNEHMFQLLNDINKTHTLVHLHANNGCNMQMIDGIQLPHVFELTFIRNDFVSEKKRNTTSLPTNLDMPNIYYKPEYKLKGFPYTV